MTESSAQAIIENLSARATPECDDARLVVFGNLHEAELRACNFKGAGAAGVRAFAPHGLLVAESPRAIAGALGAGARPFAVLLDEQFLREAVESGQAGADACGDDAQTVMAQAARFAIAVDELARRWPETPIFACDTEAFRRITEYPVSRGGMAVFARPELPDVGALLRALDAADVGMRRVCIVEDVTNYANMASLFKSAAAFGIDAVLITPSCHDPWYRRAIRASQGAVFQVPWAYIGGADGAAHWTEEGIPLLHEAGYTVAALALRDDALPLDDARLKACAKLAFVLGTEGEGLDERTIAACDHTVIIPMAHDVDSLNVAAASAVAFWEFGRNAHA